MVALSFGGEPGGGYVSSEDEDFDTRTLNENLPPTLSPLLHSTAGQGSKVYSPPPLPHRSPAPMPPPYEYHQAAPTTASSNPTAPASLRKLPPAYKPSAPTRPRASDAEMLEIKHAFKAFDFERGEGLDFRRIQGALEALQLEANGGDLEREVAELGRGPDALVDLQEFVEIASARYAKRTRREEALLVFKSWEGLPSGGSNTRKMTLKSLRNATKQMGVAIGDEELRAMLEEAGDGDGIDFEVFWRAAVPDDGGGGLVTGDGRDELDYASAGLMSSEGRE